jgi:hypothetical protein
VRRQHLQHRAESLAAELASDGICTAHVWVNHTQQPHRLSLLFEFFVNAGVIAPKNAYSNYGDGNRILRRQMTFSLAGCRKEIVIAIGGKSTNRTAERRDTSVPALAGPAEKVISTGYFWTAGSSFGRIKLPASLPQSSVPYRREGGIWLH